MRTVDDVIVRLQALGRDLPRRDGVAVFNRVYLQVTERVRDELRAGTFEDRRFVERLDVVFAALYLDAVESVDPAARSWRPVLAARRRRGVLPVQHTLAGMNAHINHDLALAVVTTCVRTRRDPDRVRADYDRVNEVLARVVRPIRQSFLDEDVVRAGRRLSPVADVVSAWSIETARDAAWVHACTLWHLRRTRLLAGRYRATLDRTVGLIGTQLLAPRAVTD